LSGLEALKSLRIGLAIRPDADDGLHRDAPRPRRLGRSPVAPRMLRGSGFNEVQHRHAFGLMPYDIK
jgi:hypothetical protein